MTWLDWIIVVLVNGAIIAYGFRAAEGKAAKSDWFLAGRTLPWWALGMSMFATSVDNADFVSITGHVYNNGLHVLTVFTLAAVLGSCLAAFVIVPVMYRAGCLTNAEFLETRFGPGMRLFSALIQIQYRTAVLGLMIWSIYLMLQGLVGLPPWLAWTTIVCLVLASATYTGMGGLSSVVWTDVLQSFVIIAGGVCLFISVMSAVGGWDGLNRQLATLPPAEWNDKAGWVGSLKSEEPVEIVEQHASAASAEKQRLTAWLHIGGFNNPASPVAPLMLVTGWIIVGLGYYTVNHTQTVRLIAAGSLWDMKMASLLGSAVGIPIMLITVLLGVCGRVLYPDLTAGTGQADDLFPRLAADFLDPGFKGVVVAAIVSASLSTFDSIGSALAALFTHDIYGRWIQKGRTAAHYTQVTRWSGIGILAIGFLYIPFIIRQRNMVDATLSLIPVFITPLFTIYLLGAVTRVHRRSAVPGLVIGGAFGCLSLLGRESDAFNWVPRLFSEKWYSYPWSVAVTACTMLLVTPLLNRLYESKEPPHDIRARTLEHAPAGSTSQKLVSGSFAVVLIALTAWLILILFW